MRRGEALEQFLWADQSARRLVLGTRDFILERVKGRTMQPCSTSNPLVIGGGIRPSEQGAVESQMNAYSASRGLHIIEDWFARSPKSWGELLTGVLYPLGAGAAYSNDGAPRTA
jgi:hypothetical protein